MYLTTNHKKEMNKVIKAELFKYNKKKVYLFCILLLMVHVLMAISNVFSTNLYAEAGQSLLYWLDMTFLMNSMLYISPIIFCVISSSNMLEEKENHFLGMLVQRKSKEYVFAIKIISNIIVLMGMFLIEVIGGMFIYYGAYFIGGGKTDLAGTLLGKGYNVEGIVFLMEYCIFYCVLIPFIVNGLGMYVKGKSKLILSFIIVIFISRMISSEGIWKVILPWNILKEFSIIETGFGGNDIRWSCISLLNAILITLILGGVCYFAGKCKLKKSNV